MKHKVKKYLGLLIFPLMLTGCTLGGSKNTEKTYNTNKIIKDDWYVEYEGLSEDTLIQEVNIDTALEKLKTEEGLLVLSSSDCPYCQTAFPILDELSKDYLMENIYYVDAKTIDQDKSSELNELLGNTLKTNADDSISLIIPDVYAFNNGEVLGNQRETEEDIDYLKALYENLFQMLK